MLRKPERDRAAPDPLPAAGEHGDRPDSSTPLLDLGPIYFDYDRAHLRSDAQEALARHGKGLLQHSETRIVVEGHCDERGSVEYNLALGERRAHAVRDFLIAYGVDAARIETMSYGEERPAVLGADETSWSRNRRASFVRVTS
jgi:peptidoglycan-associated lipoprotein